MKPLLVACALCAFAEALFLSRAPGPALSPDAASYLCATEFIARGQSPRVPFAYWYERDSTSPLRHFPPAFPALAALPTALGVPVVQAARYVEAFAFAATVALVAVAAASAAGPLAAALAALMILATPAIAQNHAMVLSEPLFLALLALLLVLMQRAPHRALLLGLVAGSAALVRYAGTALVAGVALYTFLQPGSLRERVRRACLAGLPALASLGAWRYWVGPFREYRYRSGLSAQVGDAWQTIAEWTVPLLDDSLLRTWIACAVLLAVVVVLCGIGPRTSVNSSSTPSQALRLACAVLVACYVGVVVASRLFADPDIPFDWRLMAPVTLLVEICLAVALVSAWPRWSALTRGVSATLLVLWLVGSSASLIHFTLQMHEKAVALEGPRWRQSQLARWLRDQSSALTLYSDDPTMIWHLAHRSSRLLPRTSDPTALRGFGAELRRRPSAVLGFSSPLMDTVQPALLAERLALGAPAQLDLATVWIVGAVPH